jgi:hypothetical protein
MANRFRESGKPGKRHFAIAAALARVMRRVRVRLPMPRDGTSVHRPMPQGGVQMQAVPRPSTPFRAHWYTNAPRRVIARANAPKKQAEGHGQPQIPPAPQRPREAMMKRPIPYCAVLVLVAATGSYFASAGHAGDAARTPVRVAGSGGGGGDPNEADRVAIGFDIAPVPLDLTGRDPRLVGLGSYMINAMGACNDCHTNPGYAPGGNPFNGEPEQVNAANYLAGGRAFGPFLSRNLTPQDNGLPAGRTFDEFEQAMRHGIDFECAPDDPPPCPLLQVMPWPYYGDLTDDELHAIYEFLSAIPHAEPGS